MAPPSASPAAHPNSSRSTTPPGRAAASAKPKPAPTTCTTGSSPNDIDSWTGTTWASECGATGAGRFNPRTIQRTGWGANDGTWILWFNAPADYSRTKANAYYAMGCNSPTGPCGDGAGAPHGSTHKPSLYLCGGNGDFDIITQPGANPVMLCTQANQTLISEQLDQWGTGGVNTGSKDLAGLTSANHPAPTTTPPTPPES